MRGVEVVRQGKKVKVDGNERKREGEQEGERQKERKRKRETKVERRGSSLEASCSPPEGGNAFPPFLHTPVHHLTILSYHLVSLR